MAAVNNGSILLEETFDDVRSVITVTHFTAIVAQWIDETVQRARGGNCGPRQRHLVGLDITCQPNGNIALLQLYIGNRCLIYQLLHRGDACLPGELHAFLNDNRFCFVTVALEEVVNALQMQHGLMVRNALDLGDEASKRLHREDLRWAGLDQLATEVLRLQINKPADVWRSAWWQQELSQEQIRCACFNVFAAAEIGRVLLCWKFHPFLDHLVLWTIWTTCMVLMICWALVFLVIVVRVFFFFFFVGPSLFGSLL